MGRVLKESKKVRHAPLAADIEEDERLSKYGRLSKPGKRSRDHSNAHGEDSTTLDHKTSQRILALAKEQQQDLLSSEEELNESPAQPTPRPANHHDTLAEDSSSETSEDEVVSEEPEESIYQIDEADLETLDTFLPPGAGARKTLADLIFSKIDSESSNNQVDPSAVTAARDPLPPSVRQHQYNMDPRVVDAYMKIGSYLQKYKSGSFPKLFKIIPSHPQWAEILTLTCPEEWSPNATSKATRLFISSLKPEQARVYLEGVLLQAARTDIRENGRLNVHYYDALKRSVFKPAAFFKGIIFPMCDSGCTLKEAWIIGSIITKMRIPMLHCAAALHRIASMDYTGANSLFIRLLLDKKYALPYKVLDALFEHFVRLSNTYRGSKSRGESVQLPVLWHQSLLVFSQRYACDLTQDQKNSLLDVIRVTAHASITPEIRRELVQAVARGEPQPMEVVSA